MTIQSNENTPILTLSDLELPFPASYIMEYEDPIFKQAGNKLLVGYLADDNDSSNPLEDSSGLGHVFSAHRQSSTHAEMQEALGLNSDWDADLDLVEPSHLRKAWIDAAAQSDEFKQWANETAGAQARLDEPYYKRRAQKLWRETAGEYIYNEDCIYSFSFTDDVRLEVWKDLRAKGLIGTEGTVLLDCYDHGGQVWSLAGHGMQCRWDTSGGAGVWTPDNEAQIEINRRSTLYAFGELLDNGNWTRQSGKKRYYVVLDKAFGEEKSPQFEQWGNAFAWLEQRVKTLKLPKQKSAKEDLITKGKQRAAQELAQSALDTYNDWLSGNVFGVVVATYINTNTQENPEWEYENSDECWGYIGSEWAIDALAEEMAVSLAA